MPDQPANITVPAPDQALLAFAQRELEKAEAQRTAADWRRLIAASAIGDRVMPVQLRLDETHPSDAALVQIAGVDLTRNVAGLTVTAGPGQVTTLTLELQLRPVDVDGRMRVDLGPDTVKVLRAAGWTPPGEPRTRRLPDGHPLAPAEARQQWAVVAITDDPRREQVLSLHPTHTAAQDSAITQALAQQPELDTPYHSAADISWIHRPDRGRSKLRIAATAPGLHVVLVEPVHDGYRTTDGFIPAGPCSGPVPLPDALRAQGGEIADLVDRTEELWRSRQDPASGEAAAG